MNPDIDEVNSGGLMPKGQNDRSLLARYWLAKGKRDLLEAHSPISAAP
jgi:hypothetical protein